jgi:tellurite resistance protein TehA-like permease
MTTAAAIAIVMAIVQFFKKVFPTIVQGTIAIALVFVSSIGVTLYKFLNEGLSLTFVAVTFLVTVVIGAMSAYSLLKVAGGK